MSNYFSQLLWQTAISVASPSHSSAKTHSASDRGQETIQVIDTEVSQPFAESAQPVRDSSSDASTTTKNIYQNFEINSEQETRSLTVLSQTETKTNSDPQSANTYLDIPVQQEPLIQEIEDNQSLSTFKPDENYPMNPLESPSQKNDQRKRIEKRIEKRAEKRIEQDELEQDKITIAPHPVPSVAATNLLGLRQAYLQAARDWVAEAPITLEESREVITHDRPELAVLPTTPEAAKPALRTPPISLEQGYPSEPRRPEVQDLVLSIGSINVTIEAPQADLPAPLVPPANPEPRSAPDIQPSRISRYYLR